MEKKVNMKWKLWLGMLLGLWESSDYGVQGLGLGLRAATGEEWKLLHGSGFGFQESGFPALSYGASREWGGNIGKEWKRRDEKKCRVQGIGAVCREGMETKKMVYMYALGCLKGKV